VDVGGIAQQTSASETFSIAILMATMRLRRATVPVAEADDANRKLRSASRPRESSKRSHFVGCCCHSQPSVTAADKVARRSEGLPLDLEPVERRSATPRDHPIPWLGLTAAG
jgi:hypothetical protein